MKIKILKIAAVVLFLAFYAFIICTSIFYSSLAAEEREPQIECHDVLASSQYPEVVKKLNCIRGFEYAFGKSFLPVARTFLQSGKIHLGVNCLWSDTHQYGDRDIPKIKECARNYQALISQHPAAKLELTPFTEHNIPAPQIDKYLDIAQAYCPDCRIINSVHKGGFSKKYKSEVHGTTPAPKSGPYNFSFDGTNAVDSQLHDEVRACKRGETPPCLTLGYFSKHAKSERFYLWHPRYNLRYRDKDTTPRPQRIREANLRSPTADFIESIDYLYSPRGPFQIPRNWLSKSHAEKHDAKDLKGDKYLIISPVKAKEITLKRAGRQIGSLKYYGVFDGGGHRYYSGQMAYKYGPNVDVFIGKKKYGTLNPGFRGPPYR